MKCGYNVEIYNVNELNFPWGKKLLPIFPLIYDFTMAILEFTAKFAKCEAIIRTLKSITRQKY